MLCYIATYYQYDNYGTRLQNFALTEVLKELNITPITIYIIGDKIKLKQLIINKLKNVMTYLPIVTYRQKAWKNEVKKKEVFCQFNELLNLKKIDYDQLDNIDFKDAFAIAGSDQIWSPNHFQVNEKDAKLFFLQFVPENKRYSYAPSFGISKINENKREFFSSNLRKFKKISVREQAGQSIIKDLINIEVPIVPDPVFLLDKNQWRNKLGYSIGGKKGKYILSYFLGKPDSLRSSKIKDFAKKNNYEIINIAGNYYEDDFTVPSPSKFVELIDNAAVIFTDSFHATTFSIIMDKLFYVFKRNDVDQFSRIETLLEKYDLKDQFIENETFEKVYNSGKIQVNNKSSKIKEERNLGLNYLKEIIRESSEENEDGKI